MHGGHKFSFPLANEYNVLHKMLFMNHMTIAVVL